MIELKAFTFIPLNIAAMFNPFYYRRYTNLVERYISTLAFCLRDPSPLVRRQSLMLLTRSVINFDIHWSSFTVLMVFFEGHQSTLLSIFDIIFYSLVLLFNIKSLCRFENGLLHHFSHLRKNIPFCTHTSFWYSISQSHDGRLHQIERCTLLSIIGNTCRWRHPRSQSM